MTEIDDLEQRHELLNTEEKSNETNYLDKELTRLRELVEEKSSEILNLECKLNEHELNAQLKIEQLNQDFSLKLEQQLNRFEECRRDKQSSLVMKYAAGEKKCIELTRNIDFLQSKLNDSIKENENLNEKFTKTKLVLNKSLKDVELKCEEILNLKQEIEKLKCSLALSQAREQVNHQIKETKIDQKQFDDIQKELKHVKSKVNDLEEEKNTLKDRLKCMDDERIRQVNKINEYEVFATQSRQEKSNLESEIKLLQVDLNASQEKQTDLLDFTAKLTDKNSHLQTENQLLNDKLTQFEIELNRLKTNDLNETIKFELNKVSCKLEVETNKTKYLEENLSQKDAQINKLTKELDEKETELNTAKKKHANSIKDLTRQLQQLHKKCQQYETSYEKLNEPVTPPTCVDEDTKSINNEISHCSEVICGYSENVCIIDIDKQKLVDKIVNLQKMLAKQCEKNDFLQDHVNTLTLELMKKTKIIQFYAMNQEGGMFTSELNTNLKQLIGRKIQADSFKPNEINTKLQELLEDTLIKNITLKENVETLGQEISRLSLNRQSLI